MKACPDTGTKNNCTSVLSFMRKQIRAMRDAGRLGTATNYEKAMRNLAEFLCGKDLKLSEMTEQFIADYNVFLIRRGMVRNSISFYMRILRAVYNKAARQKLVEPAHPFEEVYTGIDRTRKRAVPESVIAHLYRLELEEGTMLALARDLFIFSYCARGMAFVDIAYLKKSDIRNGMLCYALLCPTQNGTTAQHKDRALHAKNNRSSHLCLNALCIPIAHFGGRRTGIQGVPGGNQ